MSIYVINDLIHFDSEAFTLYRADAPTEPLRIGAIASRCLGLLLQADGEIVGKRELMAGAWGAFGLEVTENSLAQVVRQLRVALDKLQPGHELILTVPRIGYRINERVQLLDAAPPVAPPEPIAAPTPQVPPSPAPAQAPHAARPGDWPGRLALATAALACWVLLFKLPGLLYPIPLAERPFMESDVQRLEGVTLHLENMPEAALRPDNEKLATRARQLGQALDLGDLHVYRFAGQDRSLNLLCSGELQPGDSHCLGLQVDE
jgi:DNA-binding winged helix-turn-helix (wHTH) protein